MNLAGIPWMDNFVIYCDSFLAGSLRRSYTCLLMAYSANGEEVLKIAIEYVLMMIMMMIMMDWNNL